MSNLEKTATTDSSNITTSLISSRTALESIKNDWLRLFHANARPVPFLSWEWITTWWDHFGKYSELFVLIARNCSGIAIGIAPLQVSVRKAFGSVRVRSLEFLGYRGSSVCPDHLEFLVDTKDSSNIRDVLTSAIFSHKCEWDRIELADLEHNSVLPKKIVNYANQAGLETGEGTTQICPFITLPGSWDSFLKELKEKRRSLIKWRRKKLFEKYKVEFRSESDTWSVSGLIETLAHLHTLSRNRRGEKGNFYRNDYLNFHLDLAERMARAGSLYLAQLNCNGVPAASTYGFHVGATLFDYQKGFDPAFARDGVGSVLTGLVVEDAISRLHAKELDFLRGQEEYKYFWTSQQRNTYTVLVWDRTMAGGAARKEFQLRQFISPLKNKIQDLWKRDLQRERQSPKTES